jgi:hypothetical protein
LLLQLHYTWATSGLGTGKGAQVVAATGILGDLAHPLSLKAQSLCVGPPGDLSFGWCEDGPVRYAFQRVPSGTDDDTRKGKFFAHVLAGPSDELPLDVLASLYLSPFWRRSRAPEDTEDLPAVAASQLSPGPALPAPSREAARRAVACTLEGIGIGQTVLFDGLDAAEAVALAAVAAAAIPARLGLLAFSTAEPASSIPDFDIVAGDVGPGLTRLSSRADNDAAADAASALLEPAGRDLAAALAEGASRAEFARRAVHVAQFRSGRPKKAAGLLRVAAPAVLRSAVRERGADNIARLIAEQDDDAAELLGALGRQDRPGVLAALAAVVEKMPAGQAAAVVDLVRTKDPAAAADLVRTARSSLAADPVSAAAAVRALAADDEGLADEVVRDCPAVAATVVRDRAVAAGVRARAAAAYFADAPPPWLAALLADDLDMGRDVARAARSFPAALLETVLDRLAPAVAVAFVGELAEMGRRGTEQFCDAELWRAAGRAPVRQRLGLVARRIAGEDLTPAGWQAVLDMLAADTLAAGSGRLFEPPRLPADLQWRVARYGRNDGRANAWAEAIAVGEGTKRLTANSRLLALAHSGAAPPSDLPALGFLVLDGMVRSADWVPLHAATVGTALDVFFCAMTVTDRAGQLVRVGYARHVRSPSQPRAAAVTQAVCVYLASHGAEPQAMRERAVLVDLAAALDARHRDAVADAAKAAGPAAAKAAKWVSGAADRRGRKRQW